MVNSVVHATKVGGVGWITRAHILRQFREGTERTSHQGAVCWIVVYVFRCDHLGWRLAGLNPTDQSLQHVVLRIDWNRCAPQAGRKH